VNSSNPFLHRNLEGQYSNSMVAPRILQTFEMHNNYLSAATYSQGAFNLAKGHALGPRDMLLPTYYPRSSIYPRQRPLWMCRPCWSCASNTVLRSPCEEYTPFFLRPREMASSIVYIGPVCPRYNEREQRKFIYLIEFDSYKPGTLLNR
jgi:hypothetical protein